MLPMQPADR